MDRQQFEHGLWEYLTYYSQGTYPNSGGLSPDEVLQLRRTEKNHRLNETSETSAARCICEEPNATTT